MFDFKEKIVEAIQGMLEDFIEWALLMCNDLLLKQNAEVEFFSSVNNFLLALTSTIAVTIVLYKIIEVMSRNAAGDAVTYGPVIVNTLKSALLIPAMPFIQKILLEEVAYNMGNWMIGEGSKVSKEKIEDMLVPSNFAALHFHGAALLILLAVFALAFIAFLFSVAIFHADVMFLYLLSPLACVSVIADDNEYLGVWWRELLSLIVTILSKIFLFVIALSILINENLTFLNFLLLMGCCILLIKSPSVLRNMWYSSGSGRGMMGAMGGTTKLAARRFLLKR
ncbi:conjugal transfer protein TrbL family protein [Peribacillus frigoritolerans]|uniref:conjugal transfer protein TrbL family protein n=1 Tax=Peribacillus frigoritolerans TaxID=450367 RepID=UPI0007BF8EEE|nr:conjugal transfer protein TrbL family protein [Peribacillus frigoritolerans]